VDSNGEPGNEAGQVKGHKILVQRPRALSRSLCRKKPRKHIDKRARIKYSSNTTVLPEVLMSVAKLAISLDASMLKRLDSLVHRRFFPSRSRAIQDALGEKLAKVEKSRLAIECEKLDPKEEQEFAEEGIGSEVHEWEKY
jgi:Arc/MetJ-type ribon-helix-helix transcriptional regulator